MMTLRQGVKLGSKIMAELADYRDPVKNPIGYKVWQSKTDRQALLSLVGYWTGVDMSIKRRAPGEAAHERAEAEQLAGEQRYRQSVLGEEA